MRGLSLTQPWATLVAIGAKTIETRSWRTPYRGPLAIHAAVSFPRACRDLCYQEWFARELAREGCDAPGDLPRGVILAVVHLSGVVPTEEIARMWQATRAGAVPLHLEERERAFGDYSAGRYGWHLTSRRRLAEPVPCKGALGLWRVPPDVLERIERETR